MFIPEQGLDKQDIFKTLESYKGGDLPWQSGKVMAYVYDPGKEAREVAEAAYMMYLNENGLDPTTYPSVAKLEMDVVRMVIDLLRGDKEVVGNMTSGGTESVLLAVKTARDRARVHRPEVKEPEMILSRTAHPSFHKAATYFNVKPVVVGFDTETFKADVAAMRDAVTDNTILLVGSAPGYAQGVVDPIEEIGALALEKGLLFHVDACVGGIQLSFMRKMGYDVPPFDFSVPGVTSISTDMHKFGYAPKNASMIMFKDKRLREYTIFSCTRTTTYVLINPTILSSKSAGPMAASWAILMYLGEEGYRRIVEEVMNATRKIIDAIDSMPDLRLLGRPDMCLFSVASNTINVFQLADEMNRRGWYIQPQLATDLSPSNVHITVNHSAVPAVDEFIAELRDAVETVKSNPMEIDTDSLKQNIEQLAAGLDPEGYDQILAMAGLAAGEVPHQLALINTLLECLPDDVAEKLLVNFMNDIYR